MGSETLASAVLYLIGSTTAGHDGIPLRCSMDRCARTPMGARKWRRAMATTVRFMQEEYFSYQTASFPAFTRQTGIEVAADLLAIDLELNDPFIHEARLAFGDPPRWDL